MVPDGCVTVIPASGRTPSDAPVAAGFADGESGPTAVVDSVGTCGFKGGSGRGEASIAGGRAPAPGTVTGRGVCSAVGWGCGAAGRCVVGGTVSACPTGAGVAVSPDDVVADVAAVALPEPLD